MKAAGPAPTTFPGLWRIFFIALALNIVLGTIVVLGLYANWQRPRASAAKAPEIIAPVTLRDGGTIIVSPPAVEPQPQRAPAAIQPAAAPSYQPPVAPPKPAAVEPPATTAPARQYKAPSDVVPGKPRPLVPVEREAAAKSRLPIVPKCNFTNPSANADPLCREAAILGKSESSAASGIAAADATSP